MYLVKTSTNFTQPETFGLDRVFNFYLDVEPNVRLGVWYVIIIIINIVYSLLSSQAFSFSIN